MIKCVAKEFIYIKLEQSIVDNSKKIGIMDLDFINFQRDAPMRVNGLITRCMGKVFLPTRREIDGKENL